MTFKAIKDTYLSKATDTLFAVRMKTSGWPRFKAAFEVHDQFREHFPGLL